MEPKDRADGIKKAGSSQAEIARITGFSIQNVNAVVYERDGNTSKNPIIRAAIATVLRRPIDEVFKDHIQFYCKVYTILSKPAKIVNGKP